MSLTLNDKALTIFTLLPSLTISFIVFHNFLLQHSFNLRMFFCSDHHKTLFWHNNLLKWKDNLILNILIKSTGPYYLISINVRKTLFINLSVKISINSRLKVQVKKFQQIDTLTNNIIIDVNSIDWLKFVPYFYISNKILFCKKSYIFFAFSH